MTRLILAISSLAFSTLAAAVAAEKSDIELVFRREVGGKPPMRSIFCDVTIKNNRDFPVWYVHPNNVDSRVIPTGHIEVKFWEPALFIGDGFEIPSGYWPQKKGNVGKFVRILSLASDEFSDHFYAFRLPPGGEFRFDGYQFDCWKNVDEIEFCEVREIRINDKTNLQDWVPYSTMADKMVHMVDGTTSNENMNWDKDTSSVRKDLRKEIVKRIDLDVLDRRMVPIQKLPRQRLQWGHGWEPKPRSASKGLAKP